MQPGRNPLPLLLVAGNSYLSQPTRCKKRHLEHFLYFFLLLRSSVGKPLIANSELQLLAEIYFPLQMILL